MSLIQTLLWSAILTWLMLLVASLLKTQGWTLPGMQVAFGNRETMPPEMPVAGRADRAARNMVDNLVLFAAVMLAVQIAGKAADPQVLTGASIFFWARLVYWPVYLAGIIYLRTAIWAVSIVGLAMMVAAVW